MPPTEVIFYREEDGTVPLLDWLDSLTPKGRDKRKEREVPPKEIDQAIERKRRFEADPTAHTFRPEE